MSIERMKSLWLFAPRGEARRVLDCVAAMGMVHIADCGLGEAAGHDALEIERVYPEAADLECRVRLLSEIHAVLCRFHQNPRGFLDNFITTPLEVTKADVSQALAEIDIDDIHSRIQAQDQEFNIRAAALQEAQDALKALALLAGVDTVIPGSSTQCNTTARLGSMTVTKFRQLETDERLPETSALAVAAEGKGRVIIQAACAAQATDELIALLDEFGCRFIEPETTTVSVDAYINHCRDELQHCDTVHAKAEADLKESATANLRNVEISLGYWEERQRIAQAVRSMAESKRLTVIRAYVRDDDLEDFRKRVAAALPDVTIDARDPVPGEKVPVSLKNPKLLTPAQFTISMFGMPNYFTFDATPIVFFNFTIFFGLCFGDALYGIGLVAIGWLLARKYRDYPGLRQLFTLLAYAGVPTFIVGILTGSWGGSLFSASWLGDPNPFFSQTNPLVMMNEKLTCFNLLDKLMMALVIALMIGVVNQLIGMVCLSVSRYRKGDRVSAVLDSVFWFIALPAGVVLSATLFVEIAGSTKNVALAALGTGAIGLILTQGRKQKNIFAKLGIGVISLYGVAGTYGFSSFLNDVLSYSRLLALGLATSIVGIAFNILANMARTGIVAVDVVLILLILIMGHGANFFLSVLGSFVHSVRLVFVEFFGRFYEADAPAFAPIGTWAGRIRVIDSKTIWSR